MKLLNDEAVFASAGVVFFVIVGLILVGLAYVMWVPPPNEPEVVFIEPDYAIPPRLHEPAPPCNRCHDPVR